MLDKVLCVEDDEVTHMIFTSLNKRNSFAREIIKVYNGQQAVSYYEDLLQNNISDYPPVILLDLNMPVMDGWEFLDEFGQRFSNFFTDTRVVILSSSNAREDKEKAKNYPNVIGFIPKPLKPGILKELISQAHS